MKKVLLVAALLTSIALTAKSQSENYRAFKFDIGFGYASPQTSTGDAVKGGFLFALQPHYRLSDQLAIGLRIEGAVLGHTELVTIGNDLYSEVNYTVQSSYTLTGKYYLLNGGFRPFIGIGAGAFLQSSINYNVYDETIVIPSKTRFGVVPEAGIEAGHFRLSADYNILPQKTGYLGIKVGFFFGGGSKDGGGMGGGHRSRGYENWGG